MNDQLNVYDFALIAVQNELLFLVGETIIYSLKDTCSGDQKARLCEEVNKGSNHESH